MKILVIGSKGQLGCCISDQLSNTNYEVIFSSRTEIDIANFLVTKASIKDLNPTIVINASAYTAVDKAEDNQQEAEKINHLAVANIASTCSEIGCWLIHISTDYVFDGAASYPYSENDTTNPQSVYGDSKLKGELAIQSSGCKYLIIRTAWIYSEYGSNFLKTILQLGTESRELSIVKDQIGCPTYAQDLAKSIVAILSYLDLNRSVSGIYHYCGDEPCSWYEFACAIFSEAEIHGLKSPRNIRAITTIEYPTRTIRPAYSVLDCSKIESVFEVTRSNWRDGVKIAIDRLKSQR